MTLREMIGLLRQYVRENGLSMDSDVFAEGRPQPLIGRMGPC
jgi:hypothetical protein